jgi:hypothetical protein
MFKNIKLNFVGIVWSRSLQRTSPFGYLNNYASYKSPRNKTSLELFFGGGGFESDNAEGSLTTERG